jgi:hypothetical protein
MPGHVGEAFGTEEKHQRPLLVVQVSQRTASDEMDGHRHALGELAQDLLHRVAGENAREQAMGEPGEVIQRARELRAVVCRGLAVKAGQRFVDALEPADRAGSQLGLKGLPLGVGGCEQPPPRFMA